MQDDTLLKMKQHIKEAMESTVESAVRVVGADSLKTHITEEISKIKVSGGGVSGEELEELLDSVPIQRMNKEVEKLTGRIERSNEQTKNMLRKNEVRSTGTRACCTTMEPRPGPCGEGWSMMGCRRA